MVDANIYGSVVDSGDATEKHFTVTPNKYAAGSTPVIMIRGSVSSFAWDDGSPSWSVYSGVVTQSWRYVQLMLTLPG